MNNLSQYILKPFSQKVMMEIAKSYLYSHQEMYLSVKASYFNGNITLVPIPNENLEKKVVLDFYWSKP